MAASRVVNPLLRSAPRIVTRNTIAPAFARQSQRFISSESPVLYTAKATATGARNGHIEGSEGLKVDLTMPKSLGGKGEKGKTNPEELFAACYGACFQSAMNLTAMGMGVKLPEKPEDSIIETDVHMVGDLKKVDLGIRVDMLVKVRGVKKDELEKVVAKTKETCPYSLATKGNVETNITVEAL